GSAGSLDIVGDDGEIRIPEGMIDDFPVPAYSEAIAAGGYIKRLDGGYAVYGRDGTAIGTLSDEEISEYLEARAGMLTACALDDHGVFDFWQGLITSTQEGKGKFAEYFERFAFKARKQIKVTVEGVPGAQIRLLDGENVIGEAVCDRAGVGYLYAPDLRPDLKVEVVTSAEVSIAHVKDAASEVVFTADEVGNLPGYEMTNIELMFVIDTTGSMGDEIDYLKKEIADVIDRVKQATGAEVTLAIMVYRDEGDEYVTDYSDFTRDIEAQQAYLKQQYASGGGDFEEAVDVALTEAVAKQWSVNTTKFLIHVADAPAHDELVGKWNDAIMAAAKKGIRVLTVASSGIDEQTEYFFRSQSLLTGGVYVYLTNDSGIGGDHLEATVEERPKVEYLNDCLVRLMTVLYEGRTPDQVIQLAPDPKPDPEEGEEGQEEIEDPSDPQEEDPSADDDGEEDEDDDGDDDSDEGDLEEGHDED
ncbi:MAG: VWA domain-containing protein, partial [Clostridia bacterium]|nr:VWA domain-containing protein [Clostridia bacterium]